MRGHPDGFQSGEREAGSPEGEHKGALLSVTERVEQAKDLTVFCQAWNAGIMIMDR